MEAKVDDFGYKVRFFKSYFEFFLHNYIVFFFFIM